MVAGRIDPDHIFTWLMFELDKTRNATTTCPDEGRDRQCVDVSGK